MDFPATAQTAHGMAPAVVQLLAATPQPEAWAHSSPPALSPSCESLSAKHPTPTQSTTAFNSTKSFNSSSKPVAAKAAARGRVEVRVAAVPPSLAPPPPPPCLYLVALQLQLAHPPLPPLRQTSWPRPPPHHRVPYRLTTRTLATRASPTLRRRHRPCPPYQHRPSLLLNSSAPLPLPPTDNRVHGHLLLRALPAEARQLRPLRGGRSFRRYAPRWCPPFRRPTPENAAMQPI